MGGQQKISSVILYFFNIRMECEKKFDGIFYSAPEVEHFHSFKQIFQYHGVLPKPLDFSDFTTSSLGGDPRRNRYSL
jgi:hypothetical protein